MNKYADLGEKARDILMEFGNIGTGHATTALASMIGQDIHLELPAIQILPYYNLCDLLGGAESVVTGILLTVQGDLNGMFLFLLNDTFTKVMLRALLGEPPINITTMNEMECSAVCEIGNIMCCSYISALVSMMDCKVDISVPSMCCDMAGALLSVPMIHFANMGDEIMFIENKFHLNKMDFMSHILFLPEIDTLHKMLRQVGITYGE